MIVSTFKTGKGKSKGVLSYLLNKRDRKPPAKIFAGDSKLLQVLIDGNQRAYKYTSGVLAFRDEEHPTPEQLREIVAAFERTFAPNLDSSRFPLLWVLHRDKGNTELHFVAPMQDAHTGKQVNICPPGKQFQQMFRDFQSLVNHRYKWPQVTSKRPHKSPLLPKYRKGEKLKEYFEMVVAKLSQMGVIKTRDDLVKWSEAKGFKVTRQGNDYLSMQHGDSKAVRLKGPAFASSADYVEQPAPAIAKLSEMEHKAIERRLSRAIKSRRASLAFYLDKIPRPTPPEAPPSTGRSNPPTRGHLTKLDGLVAEMTRQQQAAPVNPKNRP